MTIGISKEMLPRIMDKISDICDNEDRINYYDIEKLLINECTELNPWLPIADAPKGRPILAWNVLEGVYETQCYMEAGKRDEWPHHKVISPGKGDLEIDPYMKPMLVTNWPQPTHYQELPEPKCNT